MRMFSPHVFTRLRQNAMFLGDQYGLPFSGPKKAEFPGNITLKNLVCRQKSQRVSWFFFFLTIFVLNVSPVGLADETAESLTMEQMSLSIDNESKKAGGIQLVVDHLKKSFNVDDRMIYVVREQEIDYGDMFTIFAMAERMPGGISEDNVTAVIDTHKGRLNQKSWPDVAALFGVEIDGVTQRSKELISAFLDSVDRKSAGSIR